MKLLAKDRAVLAHVVLDPDAWVAHALATVGGQAVRDKVERHRADYTEKSALPEYKNRAEREAKA